MTASARIMSAQPGSDMRIEIQLYLVVDRVLGITPRQVVSRARATFGSASIPASALSAPAPHTPASWRPLATRGGRIILTTQVTAWYAPRSSLYRGDTFLTDDSYYRRRLTKCDEESVGGGQTDVITFYANSALRRPLIKLEHELGHSLGIRHTWSSASPMYNSSGSSAGSRLTVSDVIDILWQINPNRKLHFQTLSSRAIHALHPSNSVTRATPVAQ
jgi:hypothetical protein